jgi:hypothetical protein
MGKSNASLLHKFDFFAVQRFVRGARLSDPLDMNSEFNIQNRGKESEPWERAEPDLDRRAVNVNGPDAMEGFRNIACFFVRKPQGTFHRFREAIPKVKTEDRIGRAKGNLAHFKKECRVICR